MALAFAGPALGAELLYPEGIVLGPVNYGLYGLWTSGERHNQHSGPSSIPGSGRSSAGSSKGSLFPGLKMWLRAKFGQDGRGRRKAGLKDLEEEGKGHEGRTGPKGVADLGGVVKRQRSTGRVAPCHVAEAHGHMEGHVASSQAASERPLKADRLQETQAGETAGKEAGVVSPIVGHVAAAGEEAVEGPDYIIGEWAGAQVHGNGECRRILEGLCLDKTTLQGPTNQPWPEHSALDGGVVSPGEQTAQPPVSDFSFRAVENFRAEEEPDGAAQPSHILASPPIPAAWGASLTRGSSGSSLSGRPEAHGARPGIVVESLASEDVESVVAGTESSGVEGSWDAESAAYESASFGAIRNTGFGVPSTTGYGIVNAAGSGEVSTTGSAVAGSGDAGRRRSKVPWRVLNAEREGNGEEGQWRPAASVAARAARKCKDALMEAGQLSVQAIKRMEWCMMFYPLSYRAQVHCGPSSARQW